MQIDLAEFFRFCPFCHPDITEVGPYKSIPCVRHRSMYTHKDPIAMYLDYMITSHSFTSQDLGDKVAGTWGTLREEFSGKLLRPDVYIGIEGHITLFWNKEVHHLEIQFYGGGGMTLFSMNMESGAHKMTPFNPTNIHRECFQPFLS